MTARNAIYVVATPKEGPVKIGISIDPWRRFKDFNNGGDCELKFIVECESRNTEKFRRWLIRAARE
jgi:hypothetical protein